MQVVERHYHRISLARRDVATLFAYAACSGDCARLKFHLHNTKRRVEMFGDIKVMKIAGDDSAPDPVPKEIRMRVPPEEVARAIEKQLAEQHGQQFVVVPPPKQPKVHSFTFGFRPGDRVFSWPNGPGGRQEKGVVREVAYDGINATYFVALDDPKSQDHGRVRPYLWQDLVEQ